MHLDDLFPVESTMECNQCHNHQPCTIDDNYCPNCGARMVNENDIEAQRDYEAAVEQMEHDILYEPTYSQEDGSM